MSDHEPILIIEDDDDHRTAMKELLEDEGYPVVECANGQRAIDYLCSRPGKVPSLILLDLNMPMMSGWEFLAIVKSYVRLSRIPVLIVSGEKPNQTAKQHGVFSRYVEKPFSAPTLLAAVAACLDSTAV